MSDDARLAGLIRIRHRCECAGATEAPGPDGNEHVFEIDGQPFPWFIRDDGPTITKHGSLYTVEVAIVCTQIDVIGLPVWVELDR